MEAWKFAALEAGCRCGDAEAWRYGALEMRCRCADVEVWRGMEGWRRTHVEETEVRRIGKLQARIRGGIEVRRIGKRQTRGRGGMEHWRSAAGLQTWSYGEVWSAGGVQTWR